MNITQAIKMAWKSIVGKKGRSFLTMLGIIIGISSVMTIVSVANGMNEQVKEQMEAMGKNRISIGVYSYHYDENGGGGLDVFDELYAYCNNLSEYVLGVTPVGTVNATVVYGTKNSNNMEYSWDENGNMTGDMPPNLYYGSDQYSICENFVLERGRDIAYMDIQNYNQVCVLGSATAQTYFGAIDPVGEIMQINGLNFEVVGVYKAKDPNSSWSDNIMVLPYTTNRVLGGSTMTEFLVKATGAEEAIEATSRITGFLSGLVPSGQGDYYVQSEDQWTSSGSEFYTMMGLVLGGIAAISLLVGGIGIMNIMLVTVTERTREIGIRRAIGASRASVVVQFLIESAMICGIGGIFGIAVGVVGSYVLGQALMKMTIYPAPWITAAAFGLSVALGMIFGIYPAAKAAKLQPVEALRAD